MRSLHAISRTHLQPGRYDAAGLPGSTHQSALSSRSNLNFHLDVRLHISAGISARRCGRSLFQADEPLRRKPVIRARSARKLQEWKIIAGAMSHYERLPTHPQAFSDRWFSRPRAQGSVSEKDAIAKRRDVPSAALIWDSDSQKLTTYRNLALLGSKTAAKFQPAFKAHGFR
jgi:hypothetical protein